MTRLTGDDPALVARAHRLQWALLIACTAALATRTMLRNLDYRSEETIWRDATIKRPHNPRAHRNLSAALAKRGDLPGAADELRRSLALFPADPEGQRSLARMLLDQGLVEPAIAQFRIAQPYAPSDISIPLELGAIHLRRGEADKAAAAFTQAVTIDPASSNAHFGMGEASLLTGDSHAMKLIERAVELSGDKAAAHVRAGRMLASRQRLNEAEAHFKAAAALKPDDAQVWSNLGNLALARKDAPQAVAMQRRAMAFERDNPELMRRLAMALASQDAPSPAELDEALRLAFTAVQRSPNAPAFLETLSMTFAAAGRFRDAELVMRRLETLAIQASQPQAAAEYRRKANVYAARIATSRPATVPIAE